MNTAVLPALRRYFRERQGGFFRRTTRYGVGRNRKTKTVLGSITETMLMLTNRKRRRNDHGGNPSVDGIVPPCRRYPRFAAALGSGTRTEHSVFFRGCDLTDTGGGMKIQRQRSCFFLRTTVRSLRWVPSCRSMPRKWLCPCTLILQRWDITREPAFGKG